MALVLCNQGEEAALQALLNQGLTLRLFTNDKTPAEGDTEAGYTEASGHGYEAHQLAFGDWVITPGAPTEAVHEDKVFTFTSALGATIYGYFVTRDTDGALLWAERMPTAFTPTSIGDNLTITAKITAD